jgi:hypothetical protein
MKTVKQLLLLSLLTVLSSSCVLLDSEYTLDNLQITRVAEVASILNDELWNLKEPKVKPVVAVYPSSFLDQTGQRRSNRWQSLRHRHEQTVSTRYRYR